MKKKINVQKRKSFSPMVKIAAGYIVVIVVGALVLMLPFASWEGVSVGLTTALFTSTSAVCVTGLTVVDTLTTFTWFGQAVILLLIQVGGIGFMTMAGLVFILFRKKLTLKDKLTLAESFNSDDISQATKFVCNVAITTFVIEFIGAVALFPAFNKMEGGTGFAIWRSVFHSIAAFCNAGFDLMGGTGVAPFIQNPLFNVVVITLVFLGGLGASTMLNLRGKVLKKEKLTFNTKAVLVASFAMLFGGALYIFVAEFNNINTIGSLPIGDKVLNALFHSMTTRSAGFIMFDASQLTSAGVVMTDLLMIIGVAPASTGGGIKLTTMIVIFASLKTAVGGGGDYTISKYSIPNKTFNKAVSIFFIYIVVLCGAVLVLCLSDPTVPSEQIMFECISAMSNCGLTMCGTGNLSTVGQYVLIFLMYMGRAGFLCVVYSIVGGTKRNVKFPDGKLVIG